MLEFLKKLNPEIPFFSVFDSEFKTFGKVIKTLDTKEIIDVAKTICNPQSGSSYIPSVKEFEELKIANEITGDQKDAYINGATYAHYLPNAYVYGMNGNCPPDDFPKGHGGAHGIDECVSIDRLKRAMRIYARALLALNEIDF